MGKRIDTDILVISKDQTSGIKVGSDNGDFSWKDIIGKVTHDPLGAAAPTKAVFVTGLNGFAYGTGDQINAVYHIPHDYVPGSDLYIHLHWKHNGTSISGTFDVDAVATYASRDGVTSSAVTTALTEAVNITSHPQYFHRVLEVQLSTSGGSASMLDTDAIEVDGLVCITFTVDNGALTIGGGTATPFIDTGDIHYQSRNVGTKNKDPNFYA